LRVPQGNKRSWGNVANEMSCCRDEGCPPVLLNYYLALFRTL